MSETSEPKGRVADAVREHWADLLPVEMLIRLDLARDLLKEMHLHRSLEPGPAPRLLPRPSVPIGVAICYEISDGAALAAAVVAAAETQDRDLELAPLLDLRVRQEGLDGVYHFDSDQTDRNWVVEPYRFCNQSLYWPCKMLA